MLITCSNCEGSFTIDPNALPPAGARVPCPHCAHVRFVANTSALAMIPKAHRADIAETWGVPPPAPVLQPPRELDGPIPPDPEGITEENPAEGAWPVQETLAKELTYDPDPGHSPERAANEPIWQEAPALPEPVPAQARSSAVGRDGPWMTPAATGRPANPRAARRGEWAPPRNWLPSSVSTGIIVLVAANLSLLAWRVAVVRALPQTASLYEAVGLPVNVRGLSFGDIDTAVDLEEGAPVLVVRGTVSNVTQRTVEVPSLRFALQNGQAREIYTWSAPPTDRSLAPGTTMQFRSRLASPPLEGKVVRVRFVTGRDILAGLE